MGMEKYGKKGRLDKEYSLAGQYGQGSRISAVELNPDLGAAARNKARLKEEADKKASRRGAKKPISLGGNFGKDKK